MSSMRFPPSQSSNRIFLFSVDEGAATIMLNRPMLGLEWDMGAG
jgi:hypothetical protein